MRYSNFIRTDYPSQVELTTTFDQLSAQLTKVRDLHSALKTARGERLHADPQRGLKGNEKFYERDCAYVSAYIRRELANEQMHALLTPFIELINKLRAAHEEAAIHSRHSGMERAILITRINLTAAEDLYNEACTLYFEIYYSERLSTDPIHNTYTVYEARLSKERRYVLVCQDKRRGPYFFVTHDSDKLPPAPYMTFAEAEKAVSVWRSLYPYDNNAVDIVKVDVIAQLKAGNFAPFTRPGGWPSEEEERETES